MYLHLDFAKLFCYNNKVFQAYCVSGCSADGSALALGEPVKTTKCCFYEAKYTKQGVEVGLYVRRATTMRLYRRRSRRCRRPLAPRVYILTSYFSGCSADGSALALGARCRRFESCHSDQKTRVRLVLTLVFCLVCQFEAVLQSKRRFAYYARRSTSLFVRNRA